MTGLKTKLANVAFERGGAIALAATIVYVLLAPTTIVDGDNAEFATLGEVGGRAHPTGYPLYVLYLRAMSWLPGASPAHTAGIATALLAGLLVLVLHAACRAWGARPLAATFACAIYAGGPVVLRMHTEAEVFALNGLVVATVLWLSAAAGPVRGVRRAGWLGLVAGLGLANHLTCVLVAPVGVLGAVRGVREAPRRGVAVAAAVGGLVVGLLPYAYLIVADGPGSYGRVDDAGGLFAFVTRQDYGGPLAFAPHGEEVGAATQLGALAATLGRGWLWLPALAGLAMLGAAIARPRGDTRWGWAMLAASFALAGPLLALRFNVVPSELGHYIVQRFHLLPLVLLAIPIAAAIDRIPRLEKPALALAAVALFAALVGAALPRLSAAHSPAMERGVRNMLRGLPPNAIAILDGDDLCLGSHYAQHALGERPDVDAICWPYTQYGWYRDQLRARGVAVVDGGVPAWVFANLATGRPVFTSSQRNLAAGQQKIPGYPYGTLVRAVGPGERMPPLAEIFETNTRLFASYELGYALPGLHDDWATVAHIRYVTTWQMLANALRAAGKPEDAARAEDFAAQLAPIGDP